MTDTGFSLSRRTTLIGAGLVGAALSNTDIAAAATSPAASPLKRGYVDGPYGQIHYRIVQPAKATTVPLLCLHASPLSSIVYANWLAEMGKDRIAVAPDTPGYGSSDAPPAPVEIGDFAAAFIRFMDEMKLKTVDVMGYHTGSLTSVELARRYPTRIRKVVMISAPVWTEAELVAIRKAQLGPAPSFPQMLARVLDQWLNTGRGMFRDETDDQYIDISLERMRRFRTSNWGFRAAFNYDLTKALPEVAQPILILNPEDDLWESTPRVKPFLKNGRIHDLPGWTHGHLDAHTVEMANVVRAFLDKA
jgi:pimeloyl-ACP methyl ester carboxylesterase